MQDIAGQHLLGDAVRVLDRIRQHYLRAGPLRLCRQALRYTGKRCPFVRLLSEARRRSSFREPPLP
jgi:hypothetical protein